MKDLNYPTMMAYFGIKVFPLFGVKDGKCLCGNDDCKSPGKHPIFKGWQEKATTDLEQIYKWSETYPDANLGLLTGMDSNLVVIDVDVNPSVNGIEVIEKKLGELNLDFSFYIETGGGGRHYYCRWTKPTRNRTRVLPGVDIRGDGGYVVGPGSTNEKGVYKMVGTISFDSLPEFPSEILNHESTITEDENTEKIKEGEGRNSFLFAQGRKYKDKGLDQEEVLLVLMKINEERCNPPVGDDELKSIAKNVFLYSSEMKRYTVNNNKICICEKKQDGGIDYKALCNFSAYIKKRIIQDDGNNKTTTLIICGRDHLGRIYPEIEIPETHYASMNWPTKWGPSAIIYPGYSTRDHLRVAIQELSTDFIEINEFLHTGWRQINEDQVYLSSAGAIGPKGIDVSVLVNLKDSRLERYSIPSPPGISELKAYVRNIFDAIMESGIPDTITVPLLGSLYRAPLNEIYPVKFTLMLVGATGVMKTTLAGHLLSSFGEFDENNIPESFVSTAYSLERKAYLIKDAWLLVDDWVPGETKDGIIEYLVRGQGNKTGRTRMNPDGTLKYANYPRCMLVLTGEDVPQGQSLRPRILVVEVLNKDISPLKIEKIKQLNRDKVFNKVMAGYVQWLASNFEKKKQSTEKRFEFLRDKASSLEVLKRVISSISDLMIGIEEFVEFAVTVGALDAIEGQEFLDERAWPALKQLAEKQRFYNEAADPIDIFITNIRSALTTGKAHLKAKGDRVPIDAANWGWKKDKDGNDISSGEMIGWHNGNEIWFQPEAAFNMANRIASSPSTRIQISRDALWKRMADKGLLTISDGETKNTIKRQVNESLRKRVVVFRDVEMFAGNINDSAPVAPNNLPIAPFGLTEEELRTQVYRSNRSIQAH